ncbi:MAG TPA: tetratricopeptide repeat protein [Thermoanaerobaculia bacterium]|nr:tetratricopeptide repeat protein [Thermoanaerobaculia bacterium]
MPPKVLPVLLLAGWAALPSLPSLSSLPWKPHLPVWAERWLWNPRERTGQAIAAWNAKDPESASDAAGTALRLAPDDPRVQYNAGTAELGARRLRQSIRLLEKAARDAPPDLAPAAHYNLGNARLAASDAAGAVEAYKKALRLTPSDANAKHNLEIALREREKEQNRMKSPQKGSRGDRPDQDNPSDSKGSGDPGDQQDQRKSDANDPGRDQQKGPPGPPQQGGPRPQQPGEGQQPLPQFRDQHDMTAQEAAALLQAVENLERQQRRKQAADRAQQRGAQEKDW